MKLTQLFAALFLASLCAFASAEPNNPTNGENEHHGERRGPPPQAIEACKGKAGGVACSFVGRNNKELTGTCFSPNPERPLACRPTRGEKAQGEKEPGEQPSAGNNISY